MRKKPFQLTEGLDVETSVNARDSGAKYLPEVDWFLYDIMHADWLIQMIN